MHKNIRYIFENLKQLVFGTVGIPQGMVGQEIRGEGRFFSEMRFLDDPLAMMSFLADSEFCWLVFLDFG